MSISLPQKYWLKWLRGLAPWSWLAVALIATSCTPVAGVVEGVHNARLDIELPPVSLLDQSVSPAQAANVVAPIPALLQPAGAATAFAFRGRTPLDSLRSNDCLAQAIYYEAASESEDGQRAVAQVVLNRVRHPSWPNSVCGVVYQGPMRAGGGCQFTFTCDGSLMRRPSGAAWARARLIAAEALAGRTFAGVGLSTHYHTHAVKPAWAPRLVRTAVIGAHNFYRLPGSWGEAGAFASRYAGTEPMPHPSAILFPRHASPAAATGLAGLTSNAVQASSTRWSAQPTEPQAEQPGPPPSTVREEYLSSGQWRADAPAALTRR